MHLPIGSWRSSEPLIPRYYSVKEKPRKTQNDVINRCHTLTRYPNIHHNSRRSQAPRRSSSLKRSISISREADNPDWCWYHNNHWKSSSNHWKSCSSLILKPYDTVNHSRSFTGAMCNDSCSRRTQLSVVHHWCDDERILTRRYRRRSWRSFCKIITIESTSPYSTCRRQKGNRLPHTVDGACIMTWVYSNSFTGPSLLQMFQLCLLVQIHHNSIIYLSTSENEVQ